jgi:hypothetical protein
MELAGRDNPVDLAPALPGNEDDVPGVDLHGRSCPPRSGPGSADDRQMTARCSSTGDLVRTDRRRRVHLVPINPPRRASPSPRSTPSWPGSSARPSTERPSASAAVRRHRLGSIRRSRPAARVGPVGRRGRRRVPRGAQDRPSHQTPSCRSFGLCGRFGPSRGPRPSPTPPAGGRQGAGLWRGDGPVKSAPCATAMKLP